MILIANDMSAMVLYNMIDRLFQFQQIGFTLNSNKALQSLLEIDHLWGPQIQSTDPSENTKYLEVNFNEGIFATSLKR